MKSGRGRSSAALAGSLDSCDRDRLCPPQPLAGDVIAHASVERVPSWLPPARRVWVVSHSSAIATHEPIEGRAPRAERPSGNMRVSSVTPCLIPRRASAPHQHRVATWATLAPVAARRRRRRSGGCGTPSIPPTGPTCRDYRPAPRPRGAGPPPYCPYWVTLQPRRLLGGVRLAASIAAASIIARHRGALALGQYSSFLPASSASRGRPRTHRPTDQWGCPQSRPCHRTQPTPDDRARSSRSPVRPAVGVQRGFVAGDFGICVPVLVARLQPLQDLAYPPSGQRHAVEEDGLGAVGEGRRIIERSGVAVPS